MSSYIVPIKVGIIVFPIIALLITLPYMIKQYHKYGSIPLLRTFVVYSFVLYLLIAWFMVILPLPSIKEVSKYTTPWTQLVPFQGLKDIIATTNFNILDVSTYLPTLKNPCVYTVLFNFVLTIPFGVYLRYYFKRRWWEVFILSFLLSLFFEVTQISGLFGIYPRPYRLFDVDDLIVNTTGGLIGFVITPIICMILPSREELDEKAYNKGQKVSYPRRFIASLLDFILVALFTFSGIFNIKYLDPFILVYLYLLYHIICTLLLGGRTLGKFIVGIKVVGEDGKRANIYQILTRYTVKFMLYFEVFYVTLTFNVTDTFKGFGNYLVLAMYVMLLLIFLKSFIDAVRRKPLVYESMSHTKHISTIKNKYSKVDKEEKKEQSEIIKKKPMKKDAEV